MDPWQRSPTNFLMQCEGSNRTFLLEGSSSVLLQSFIFILIYGTLAVAYRLTLAHGWPSLGVENITVSSLHNHSHGTRSLFVLCYKHTWKHSLTLPAMLCASAITSPKNWARLRGFLCEKWPRSAWTTSRGLETLTTEGLPGKWAPSSLSLHLRLRRNGIFDESSPWKNKWKSAEEKRHNTRLATHVVRWACPKRSWMPDGRRGREKPVL